VAMPLGALDMVSH